jgi:hypothetical protein
MNTLKIEINTENDAFVESMEFELCRILLELTEKLGGGVESGSTFILRDINGNTVGKAIAE